MGLSLHLEDLYFDNEKITITADLLFEPEFKSLAKCRVRNTETDFELTLESEVAEDYTVSFTLSAGTLPVGDYRVRIVCEGAEISDLFMVIPQD